jgi:hypothetical protein
MTPLGPFLALCLFFALQSVVSRLAEFRPAHSRWVRSCLTAVVILTFFVPLLPVAVVLHTTWRYNVHYDIGPRRETPETIRYRLFFYTETSGWTNEALDWLRTRATAPDVIAAPDPQWAYLRTGLHAVLPPLETDSRRAQHLLDTVPVRYLIVDDGDYGTYTSRVVEDFPDLWRLVYKGSGVPKLEVYERAPRL